MPDDRLIACERFEASGAAMAVTVVGSRPSTAQGTVFAVHDGAGVDALAGVLRESLDRVPGVYAGASLLPAGCGAWARLLAADGVSLRAGPEPAWFALRTHLIGASSARRRKVGRSGLAETVVATNPWRRRIRACAPGAIAGADSGRSWRGRG